MVSSKETLKRQRTGDLISKSKKMRLEKEDRDVASNKRSRPVTHTFPIVEETDSDVESQMNLSNGAVDDMAEDEYLNEKILDEDADDGQQTQKPMKNDTSRESHKAQKVLYEQRKASKPHFPLLTEAKRIWSLARQHNIPSNERQKHVQNLMNVIRGKVEDIVLKHDASRIVQTVVKYGRQKERDEVALELKGKYKDLAQNKYSKFLVAKLIRLCPTHRASILQEFQSHVLRLLLHREASSVLADAFELHANAYERTLLVWDFYGKEALLFSVTKGSAQDKERAKKGLVGILEEGNDERRKRILAAVKENLLSIFNNSDKGAVNHAIVHRVLWEYLSAINSISDQVEREKLRREMFESCQELLAEMVHTKDGSRVVREFLAEGTAKDRKQIIKVLKPHIERMCLDDEAQLVIFTTLDVTDDTKLLSKSIVTEIINSASNLYSKPQGRRALLYLLTPRSRRHFMPSQIASLEETDPIRMRTSKKDPEARIAEIRNFASEPLLHWVEENALKIVRETEGVLVVTEIMLYADGDKMNAIKILLNILNDAYPPAETSPSHPIDLPWTSRMYKILLQGGHYNHKSNCVEKSPHWDSMRFASSVVATIPGNVLRDFCTEGERNGGFFVTTLCEALIAAGKDGIKEREKLRVWFGEEVRDKIARGEGKGKAVLLENLALIQ